MQLFQQSEATAARRRFPVYLVDATDGLTPETGEGSGQPQISKNGGAWANTTATLTAIGNGAYYVELTATELDTVGEIQVRYKSAATAEFNLPAQVVPWDPYDSVRLGITSLPNADAEASGGLFTRGTGAGQINQAANGQIDSNAVAVGGTTQTAGDLMGSLGEENATAAAGDPSTTESVMQYVKQLVNVLIGTSGIASWPASAAPANAVSIAEALRAVYDDTNSLDGTKIPDTISLANINAEADTALSDIGLDHLLSAAVAGTDVTDDSVIAQLVSASATADWDDFDNTTDALQALRDRGDAAWTTGAGSGLTPLASGTAQGGTASTIQLASGETFADDELNGNVVKVTSGTGAGQARLISDYTGSTDTATVTPNWTTTPDATSVYEVVQGTGNVQQIEGSDATDQINAACDSAIETYGLDHLLSASVTGTDITDDSIIAQLVSASATADWDDFDNTTDALQAIRDRGDAAWTTGAGSGLTPLASGTAQGGTSTTIQLASGETFANDELIGNIVKITSGTGAGQARLITDNVGSTDTCTITPSWTTNPDSSSVYEIVEGTMRVGTYVSGAITTASFTAGAINAAAIEDNSITADKIQANAIGASELATDGINEIRDAILSDSTPFAGANIDAAISSRSTVTTAQVNSEVDTALADIGLDHLLSASVAGTDVTDDSVIAQLVSASATADWDDFDNTTDSLEALQADHVTLQSDTDDIQTRLPAALVSGRMDADVGAMQSAVITAAAIATDAIGSAELADSAAQKIRDEILPTQNAAFTFTFLWVAASDHVTPVTSASGTTVTRSIDGAAFGSGTGTLTEVSNGIYEYAASAADMNGGVITFRFVATGGTPGAPDDAFVTVVTTGGV